MSDTTASQSRFSRFFVTRPDPVDLDNKYTEAALERHKREGLELAVRARWIAMGLTGILLVFLNPHWEVLWYHFILLLICAAGTLLLWPLSQPAQILALPPTQLAVLLFCGLNTIVAYGAFGLAMSYWQASRVSAIIPLAPLLTLLFTAMLNHWQPARVASEPINTAVIVGALLVVAGSALAALPKR